MEIVKSSGMRCLAAYLIITGLVALLNLRLGNLSFLLHILAIVAGVLLLRGK
jgi:hypothetical protein